MNLLVMAATVGGGAIVTVTGQTLIGANAGTVAVVEVRWTDAGIVEWRENDSGPWIQLSAATDWVRPESAAPGQFQIRFRNLTGDALVSSTVAEDVWHPFSGGNFVLRQEDNSPGAAVVTSTFDVEIRVGTGAPLDSDSWTLTADRDDS